MSAAGGEILQGRIELRPADSEVVVVDDGSAL